jgi:hypothetical protein
MLFDSSGRLTNGIVTIQMSCSEGCASKGEIIGTKQTLSTGGHFNYTFTNTEDQGKYNITASVNGSKIAGWTSIQIKDILYLGYTPLIVPFLVGLSSVIGFICFLIVFSKTIKQPDKKYDEVEQVVRKGAKLTPEYDFRIWEIYRFLCITGIAMSPLLLFIMTNIGIGTNSPIGLVIRQPVDEKGIPLLDANKLPISQWVIHVGGTQNNNYATGLNIPFYVIGLGILGGYLRYLYDTYEKVHEKVHEEGDKKTKRKPKGYEEIKPAQFLHNTFGELAEVLLSPLLAIAVWFILSQGSAYANTYVLAAVSFVVGLIANEVIDGLVSFAGARLPDRNKDATNGSAAKSMNSQQHE